MASVEKLGTFVLILFWISCQLNMNWMVFDDAIYRFNEKEQHIISKHHFTAINFKIRNNKKPQNVAETNDNKSKIRYKKNKNKFNKVNYNLLVITYKFICFTQDGIERFLSSSIKDNQV